MSPRGLARPAATSRATATRPRRSTLTLLCTPWNETRAAARGRSPAAASLIRVPTGPAVGPHRRRAPREATALTDSGRAVRSSRKTVVNRRDGPTRNVSARSGVLLGISSATRNSPRRVVGVRASAREPRRMTTADSGEKPAPRSTVVDPGGPAAGARVTRGAPAAVGAPRAASAAITTPDEVALSGRRPTRCR
jgi:hypothetical protein